METIRRKSRRRMAYIAIYSIIVAMLLVFFVVPLPRLTVLSEVITWFFFVMGSVIGSYMGFATFDDKWQDLHLNKKKTEDKE